MSSDKQDEAALDKALAELPKGVEPARDLWPEIEARINDDHSQSLWQWAAAATVVLAVGALMVRFGQPDVADPVLSATPAPNTLEVPAFETPRPLAELTSFPGEGFAVTRDAELAQFAKQLALLPEAERQLVTDNLNVIRRAIAEIDAALAENPDNALLKELLLSNYRQELDTMNRINRVTRSMRADL